MIFQPQKPQTRAFFLYTLPSMLSHLSPFSFPSVIAVVYKKNPLSSSFLHAVSPQQEPSVGPCAYHAEPAAAMGRGRQATRPAAAWQRELAAVPLLLLSLQPLPSVPSVAAVQSWALANRRRSTWGRAAGCLLVKLIIFDQKKKKKRKEGRKTKKERTKNNPWSSKVSCALFLGCY